jgi:hypothetical protein
VQKKEREREKKKKKGEESMCKCVGRRKKNYRVSIVIFSLLCEGEI